MNKEQIINVIKKYLAALDFINRNKCDIISPSENAEIIKAN